MFDVKYMLAFALWASCGLATAQPAEAVLKVSGDVPSPLALKPGDLAGMKRSTISVDAGGGSKIQYEGVMLRELLNKAGAPSGEQLRGKKLASYVLAKARDGYRVAFTLAELDAEFANEQILVADRMDGKPLAETSGPIRLVCPNDKAQARSVRMLESIEVVNLEK